MSWKRYAALFAVGVFIAILTASFQGSPGYMDADYYLIIGKNLADGSGFSEQVLWNYLDDPHGLPHPSHTYWMPLTSIVAAIGIWLFPSLDTFYAGRILLLLAAAMVPAVTAALAYQLTDNKKAATFAGVLALVPGFYLPFWTTTDSFGVLMLLGAGFFVLVHRIATSPTRRIYFFLLGLTAGLMHLARADGVLWLIVAFWLLFSVLNNKERIVGKNSQWFNIALLVLGYLAIMGPWYARNFLVFGAPLAPGSTRTLWLNNYDEFFSFPASMLTPERWMTAGIMAIIQDRFSALLLNLRTVFLVHSFVLLSPFIVIGGWTLRNNLVIRIGVLAWMLILLTMTIVFPYSGGRGGFFHSGAALQPLLWALIPVGLDKFAGWWVAWRNWQFDAARRFFRVLVVFIAGLVTIFVLSDRLIGPDLDDPVWGLQERNYQSVEMNLQEAGAIAGETVLVNNPPGYHLVSGRPAIVIPNGDEATLLAAAVQYGARYLVLESDHPDALDDLFENPGDRTGLQYLGTAGGAHLFLIHE